MRKEVFNMKTIRTVLFVLLITSLASAQQRWTKTYGGSGNDQSSSAQQTSDGGYVVAGYTNSYGAGGYNVWLVKTNASGDTVWTRTYGGSLDDVGLSVQQTSDGGYIVTGWTNSFGAGKYDVWLIKTNASGDTLWTRTYGGTGMDEGESVQQTSDGGYIVAGYTNSFGAGIGDVYLIKTNASGDTLWTRTYGGARDDWGYSVRQTSDGGYIVAGTTLSFGAGGYDAYLIKTNPSGDTLWTRTFGGAGDDEGHSVQQTSDGGYVIAGSTNSFGAGGYDAYLIKTNASGGITWTKTYGGLSDDWSLSVLQNTDGGYTVAGLTASFGAGGYDVYLVRTSASGDTLWTRTYGTSNNEYSYSVRPTSDEGYIIAGQTQPPAGAYDVYLIKTDANGSAAVEEPARTRPEAAGRVEATPNPFESFTRIPGHEGERFNLYDISGKIAGTYRGDRIGEGLSPAVYFIKLDDNPGGNLRIVKVR